MHRVQYSYQLMHEDRFLFRYDRDPSNHPETPDHKHLPTDRCIPTLSVTFREVLEEAFNTVHEIEAE